MTTNNNNSERMIIAILEILSQWTIKYQKKFVLCYNYYVINYY